MLENVTSVEKESLEARVNKVLISINHVSIAWEEIENPTEEQKKEFRAEFQNLQQQLLKLKKENEVRTVTNFVESTDSVGVEKEKIIKELIQEEPNQQTLRKKSKSWGERFKQKFRRGLLYMGITAGVGSAVSPIKIKEGDFSYTMNNAIENTTSILLTDDLQQTAIRGLTKWGLYDPTQYEEVVEVSDIKKAPEVENIISIEEQKEIAVKEKYKKDNTYFEVIKKVRDSHHKSRKNTKDSLLMVRNQFFNEDGYTYTPGAVKERMGGDEKYTGVEGVAHFLILDDYGCDLSEHTSDEELKHYSSLFKKDRIGKDIKKSDYVPVFQRLQDGKIKVTYKIAENLSENDITITRLHQYNFGDIDWNANVDGKYFGFEKGGVHGLALVDGTRLPNFLYTDAGKDAYSRFSGASVVFIFKDKMGNEIVRDFTGSINAIKREGEQIASSFKIDPQTIVMGVYDAGSYTAKPASVDGVLDTKQYTGYNDLHPRSGGSLMYPIKK